LTSNDTRVAVEGTNETEDICVKWKIALFTKNKIEKEGTGDGELGKNGQRAYGLSFFGRGLIKITAEKTLQKGKCTSLAKKQFEIVIYIRVR
jgi:hypothetical protein